MKSMSVYNHRIWLVLVEILLIAFMVETNQVQNKHSYLSQDVVNSTVKDFDSDFIRSLSLQKNKKSQRKLSAHIPKCKYQKSSSSAASGVTAFQETTSLKFVCACHSHNKRFRGTLSSMMDESLSMVPLHLIRGQTQIMVHIEQCDRLRITVDFAALLMTRPGGTHSNISMKISGAERVYLRRVRLAPSREHEITVENVSEKVSVSGRIDCVGCSSNEPIRSSNLQRFEEGSTSNLKSFGDNAKKNGEKSMLNQGIKWPTQFRLNVNSVGILDIEEVRADVPMTLSVRNANQLMVRHSFFERIAWPGFYIFNITSVTIKENAFPDIAPRSIVAKRGKELVISNNILDVATAVDIAQFEHVTVRCNRKLISSVSLAPTEENCPKNLNVPLVPKFTLFDGINGDIDGPTTNNPSSTSLVLFGYATTVLGYIWLVAISLIFLLIATYKYMQIKLEPKDAPKESAEIINNDQSKLFDGCMSSNVTNEVIAPTADEEICNNVFGGSDGRRYDDYVRKKYNYSGNSHFANEVPCYDERCRGAQSYPIPGVDLMERDPNWLNYPNANRVFNEQEYIRTPRNQQGWLRYIPSRLQNIFRKEETRQIMINRNELPQSIPGSVLQPDEYSNSSRLHLASSGGPPPDILLQSGVHGEFRRIDSPIQYDSSISLRHERHRYPIQSIHSSDNYYSKSEGSGFHNYHHRRRRRKHHPIECMAMKPIVPNRDPFNETSFSHPPLPVLGPASLPPPSPYSHPHFLNSYSNRSHRKFRQKYTPYRNKKHRNHRHHYDRYRYHVPSNYINCENDGQHMEACNDPSCYCYRYKNYPKRSNISESMSNGSAMDREMDGVYCSSCDELESCQASQCSCRHNYIDRRNERAEKQAQSNQRNPSKEFTSISHQDSLNCSPPLLPPKKSLSKLNNEGNPIIETQVFENPNYIETIRESRSKSRQLQPSTDVASTSQLSEVDRNNPPPLFQKLDMMSLSKQSQVETSCGNKKNTSSCDDVRSKHVMRYQKSKKVSDSHVLPQKDVPFAPSNPFLVQKDGESDMAESSNYSFLGQGKHGFSTKSQNTSDKSDIHGNVSYWVNEVTKSANDSQPSTIELLREDSEHEDSSTESMDTNSFSEYIPGPSVDHASLVPSNEVSEHGKERHHSNLIPLMKQSSNQFVIAHQESPKISKHTKIIAVKKNDKRYDDSSKYHEINIDKHAQSIDLNNDVIQRDTEFYVGASKNYNDPHREGEGKVLNIATCDDVMSSKHVSDHSNETSETEHSITNRFDVIRPPTRRAYLISAQSSVTEEGEKNSPLEISHE